ncbi:MAG: [FeFe] hydrogenase H-cluster radical SAM maturase HydE [Paludibacteraceae bacterium]|nr:[FeFe] hydrogenase H-cluster radical SAM maturase HydE [Paludibacteraceae bacterium]
MKLHISDTAFTQLLAAWQGQEYIDNKDYQFLLSKLSETQTEMLMLTAQQLTEQHFNKGVYLRGLLEITNYCKNNCFYCGIRADNHSITRYRLYDEEILNACRKGAEIGFQTFVLQGGEDPTLTDERLCTLIRNIKSQFPQHAITLSLGERSHNSYKILKDAGADRYLLRHETHNPAHYSHLHPTNMSLTHRLECLYQLKELGFQTGAGMMIGSPGQTIEHITEDLRFLDELKPQMIGIGPFVPAANTPFQQHTSGSTELTLLLLSLLRLRHPNVLLPATTALNTRSLQLRTRAIICGANVLMPNISPAIAKENYQIYQNKQNDCETVQQLQQIETSLTNIGYHINWSRGDYHA